MEGRIVRAAVFLDRDDTLIVNREITSGTAQPGSLFDPELVRLCEGAAEACARLKHAGYALVVVTNQSCIARGQATVAQVEATNRRMCEVVWEEARVEIDGVYFSPYHPEGCVAEYAMEHATRKPEPGMVLRAAEDLRLDLGRSWMIGDAERDVQAALRAGIDVSRTIVVGEAPVSSVGHRVKGMREAAGVVLGR